MNELSEGLRKLRAANGQRCDSAIILWEEATAIAAELAKVTAERDALRTALKPFAEYAVHFPLPHCDYETVLMECTDAPNITFGDCRRAAELLAATEPK